jgi:hypothetical protein
MSATQKWLGRIFFRVNSTVPVLYRLPVRLCAFVRPRVPCVSCVSRLPRCLLTGETHGTRGCTKAHNRYVNQLVNLYRSGGSRDTHTVCTGKVKVTVQQNLSPPLNKVVQVLQVNLNLNQDLHEHTGFTAPRVETKKLTPPRTQSRSIRDYKSSNVALPDDGWPVAAKRTGQWPHKRAVSDSTTSENLVSPGYKYAVLALDTYASSIASVHGPCILYAHATC